MAIGLMALLDDIAAMAKIAAASLDDVSAAAVKVGAKAAGVVIDDAAVTPRYVTGLTPDRELPIIWRIALGSLRNKLFILLPAALLLSAFAPWALTPILMLGGAYLCFEGAEKLIGTFLHHAPSAKKAADVADSSVLEKQTISGAIRTDLILSAEIVAISLAGVEGRSLWEQALILAIVSVGITAAVYGVVALIVKLDDIGLYLARGGNALLKPLGKVLVRAMPVILAVLTVVGTAAMLWVGGSIVLHGMEHFHIDFPAHQLAMLADRAAQTVGVLPGLVHWFTSAVGFLAFGVSLGTVIATGWKMLERGSAN